MIFKFSNFLIIQLLVLALCLIAVFACTAESRSHGKMTALLKRMTLALNQDVIEGRAEIAGFKGPDDCADPKYYCAETDTCCSNPVDSGDDDDYVCCPEEDYPYICATDADTCDWHP